MNLREEFKIPATVKVARDLPDLAKGVALALSKGGRVLLTSNPGARDLNTATQLGKLVKAEPINLEDSASVIKSSRGNEWMLPALESGSLFVGQGDNLFSVIDEMGIGVVVYMVPDYEHWKRTAGTLARTHPFKGVPEWRSQFERISAFNWSEYKKAVMGRIKLLYNVSTKARQLTHDGATKRRRNFPVQADRAFFLVVYAPETLTDRKPEVNESSNKTNVKDDGKRK